MMGLDGGRINIATCSVGGAQFALDQARDYTGGRKQFGKELSRFQNTQFKLADMMTSLQASRLMVNSSCTGVILIDVVVVVVVVGWILPNHMRQTSADIYKCLYIFSCA